MISTVRNLPQLYSNARGTEVRDNRAETRQTQAEQDRAQVIEAEWRPLHKPTFSPPTSTRTNLPAFVIEEPTLPGSARHLRAIAHYQRSSNHSKPQRGALIDATA